MSWGRVLSRSLSAQGFLSRSPDIGGSDFPCSFLNLSPFFQETGGLLSPVIGKLIGLFFDLFGEFLSQAPGVRHPGRTESHLRPHGKGIDLYDPGRGQPGLDPLTNRSWSRTILSTLISPNKALWWVLGSTILFLGLVLYVPFLRTLFHFSRLHLNDLILCLSAGLVSILWFEGLKAVNGQRKDR
jgi:Cation transporting ATPase, C-terminus